MSNAFWTDGWHQKLDMPSTAVLLLSLHEKSSFELVTERVPEWYGSSPDTAERGLKSLERLGILSVDKRIKKATLAPMGTTVVNVYTLVGPFAARTGTT